MLFQVVNHYVGKLDIIYSIHLTNVYTLIYTCIRTLTRQGLKEANTMTILIEYLEYMKYKSY